MTQDERFIRRCLSLALNGLGRTRPNPLVGCVVVRDERVITEGYHQVHGQYHAERNAILRSKESLRGATLYVNLEPCSHYGLTPPCADLIVEHGLGKVVCCNDDPNPQVSGRGFSKLEAAGIEVVRHVLESEGRFVNRRFFTFMEQRRPYVILKWAESADGFMAPAGSEPYWISNRQAKLLSHKWRTEEAAILVGSQTYLTDHPQLNARLWSGADPQPVVLDRRRRLDDVPSHWLHLDATNVAEALAMLYERKLQSVIVEGGRQVLDAFICAGLWDEVRVFRASHRLGGGLPAPQVPSHSRCETQQISDNSLTLYYR